MNSCELNNFDISFNESLKSSRINDFNIKSIYFLEKENFRNWLDKKNKSENYIKDIIRTGDKFFSASIKDYNSLKQHYDNLESNKYPYLLLRNLIKYFEEKELVSKPLIEKLKKDIKKSNKTNLDVYVPSTTEIKSFLERVKDYCVKDYVALKILLESGLRITEVLHFINNFEKKKIEVNKNIIVYPLYYIRGNKSSYYLFISKKTYEEFLTIDFNEYSFDKLKSWIKRNNQIPLKYTRKYHFTQMIQAGIEFEIANFIQGRCSKNVGFNHYLAKKELAVKEYEKLSI